MRGCILGIDPGITGGLAFLRGDQVDCHDIPAVAGEVNVAEIMRLIGAAKPDMAVVELASSRPGQGVSSTFKYGAAYGALQACVIACRVPLHRVTPAKWKKHFRLDSDKEKARALAIRLWPDCTQFSRKADHGRAESALIARYGAEVIGGQ
jgi:Holliday junction resolvasome RuvABC endonuclease subunit